MSVEKSFQFYKQWVRAQWVAAGGVKGHAILPSQPLPIACPHHHNKHGWALPNTQRVGLLPSTPCMQIVAALAHIHAAGVMHRDLKTSNILFSGSGLIKLADFGIAKVLDAPGANSSNGSRPNSGNGGAGALVTAGVSSGPMAQSFVGGCQLLLFISAATIVPLRALVQALAAHYTIRLLPSAQLKQQLVVEAPDRLPTDCCHAVTTPLGTPNYLAPEMINCEPYNQKADVWAMGCLLYEMAALRPAFKVGVGTQIVHVYPYLLRPVYGLGCLVPSDV